VHTQGFSLFPHSPLAAVDEGRLSRQPRKMLAQLGRSNPHRHSEVLRTNHSKPITYSDLAEAILGPLGRHPFADNSSWRGVRPEHWYKKSAFSMQHRDLALMLMRLASEGCWILEIGSFIGNSAVTWVKATRAAALASATVVTMDSWLGDVGMWQWKDKWLGPRSSDGSPRLFEQFMANIVDKNASDRVLPLRVPSAVGLRYLLTLLHSQAIPPPHLIYLDAAHDYPETLQEIQLAWQLLGPGGFLVGDDFDRFWPSVQQSVIEFTQTLSADEVDLPSRYAAHWDGVPLKRMRVAVVNGQSASEARILLKNSQWLLRKAPADGHLHVYGPQQVTVTPSMSTWPFLRATARCCLNGWTSDKFTTCHSAKPFMSQRSCNVHGVHADAEVPAGGRVQRPRAVVGVGRCKLFACHGCTAKNEKGCSS